MDLRHAKRETKNPTVSVGFPAWGVSFRNVFDPCPAGWRVPRGGKSESGVWNLFSLSNRTTWLDESPGTTGGIWDTSVSHNAPVWYPATGTRYRTVGSLRETAQSVLVWSSTMADGLTYYLWVRSGQIYNYGYGPGEYIPANGHPVRCIRE